MRARIFQAAAQVFLLVVFVHIFIEVFFIEILAVVQSWYGIELTRGLTEEQLQPGQEHYESTSSELGTVHQCLRIYPGQQMPWWQWYQKHQQQYGLTRP